MKPSEAKEVIEKQIINLEVKKICKMQEIWKIETEIEKKREALLKLQ